MMNPPQESVPLKLNSGHLSVKRRKCLIDHLCISCQLCFQSPIKVHLPGNKLKTDIHNTVKVSTIPLKECDLLGEKILMF